MSKLEKLSQLGQSVWYDFIQRSLLTSGELQRWVARGVRGVTSNPAIFKTAIAGSGDYDQAVANLANEGKSINEIYESLALEDIATAAGFLENVYDAADGRDGFVSLEVNPELAHDTEGTVAEAKRLYQSLARPNVMIKVPATSPGIAAIEALIAAGINVNVTLIFGIDNYKQVAAAYMSGLDKLALSGPLVPAGHPVNRVASVASFFVSRLDSTVDKKLTSLGREDLRGKTAIANAKLAYQTYRQLVGTARWEALAAQGAGVQRLLWASTSTKDPALPDTLYVDALIGRDTVNTIPPATLAHFLDHGSVSETLTRDVQQAGDHFAQIEALGIDLSAVTRKLQDDGVIAFATPFGELMTAISNKVDTFQAGA